MNQGPASADEALTMLEDGNARFVGDERCGDSYQRHTKLEEHLDDAGWSTGTQTLTGGNRRRTSSW